MNPLYCPVLLMVIVTVQGELDSFHAHIPTWNHWLPSSQQSYEVRQLKIRSTIKDLSRRETAKHNETNNSLYQAIFGINGGHENITHWFFLNSDDVMNRYDYFDFFVYLDKMAVSMFLYRNCHSEAFIRVRKCYQKAYQKWKISPSLQSIQHNRQTCCAFWELTQCIMPAIGKGCNETVFRENITHQLAPVYDRANSRCYPFMSESYVCVLSHMETTVWILLPLITFVFVYLLFPCILRANNISCKDRPYLSQCLQIETPTDSGYMPMNEMKNMSDQKDQKSEKKEQSTPTPKPKKYRASTDSSAY